MGTALQTPPEGEIVARFEKFLEQEEPENFTTEEPKRAEKPKEPVDRSSRKRSPAPEPDEELDAAEAASDEASDDSPEESTPTEADESEAPEAAAQAKAEDEIETLSDLAGYFGVEEPELLDTLQVVPAEGEAPVPLAKVLQAYRGLPPDADAAKEFEAEVEAFRIRAQEREEAAGKAYTRLQTLTSALISMVEGDRNDEELAKLKEYDPTEYIRRTDELAKRRALIERSIEELKGKEADWKQQQQAETAERNKKELAAVYRVMPEWREKAKGAAAMEQIASYAKSRGFSDEDLATLTDHRSILALWDASEYARIQQRQKQAHREKRLLKIPRRNLKGGARNEATEAQAAQKQARAKFARLRKSGSVEDAAAIFEDLID